MKVLLVSTFDISGGAARAAYRLHEGLCSINVDSQMLVQFKQSQDITVIGKKASSATALVRHGTRILLDQLPLKLYRQQRELFSPQWVPDRLVSRINGLKSDIVNLHWTHGGYLQIESVAKVRQPIVWTLHDMWAFTGGCHYSQNCDRYTVSCGACPQLGSNQDWDISRWIWQRKAGAWKNQDLTIITPSRWLAKRARASSLLANSCIEVIPNGLDTTQYRPLDSRIARRLLKLPEDKTLILTSAIETTGETRKGSKLLLTALQELHGTSWQNEMELVVLGSARPQRSLDIGFKIHYLGNLSDDASIALAYSAANAFVAPSIHDNLPNTVMEALACGTPCIAFDIGGMSDMIEHERNGYLAIPYQIQDLAKGIVWVVSQQQEDKRLSENARQKVEREFTQEIQAERYRSLFSSILNKTNHKVEVTSR